MDYLALCGILIVADERTGEELEAFSRGMERDTIRMLIS